MQSKSDFSQLPVEERPREKLLARGPSALSDAELFALILRTGIKGKSVLEMSREMLASFGGVARLLNANEKQLRSVKGMGRAKYAEVAAVVELAKRALAAELSQKPVLGSAQQSKDYVQHWLAARQSEGFGVLFLNARLMLIRAELMFEGTLTQASVYPREIARRALELNAASIVLAHNHPSGCLRASRADIELTRVVREALALLDIQVADHVIVSGNGALSFVEQGLL